MGGEWGRPDVFPTTVRTWLERMVAMGPDGLSQARAHVMRVYAWPLTVYLRGSTFRALEADEEDLVHGFLEDRLSRDTFLDAWRASGRRLRHWLLVGFRHYLLETCRRKRREGRAGALPSDDALAVEDAPHAEFERQAARALVDMARSRARDTCASAGLEAHWECFLSHTLDEEDFKAIGARLGVSAERASVMARTASNHFKTALREAVGRPGGSIAEADREIALLMEELAR